MEYNILVDGFVVGRQRMTGAEVRQLEKIKEIVLVRVDR